MACVCLLSFENPDAEDICILLILCADTMQSIGLHEDFGLLLISANSAPSIKGFAAYSLPPTQILNALSSAKVAQDLVPDFISANVIHGKKNPRI